MYFQPRSISRNEPYDTPITEAVDSLERLAFCLRVDVIKQVFRDHRDMAELVAELSREPHP